MKRLNLKNYIFTEIGFKDHLHLLFLKVFYLIIMIPRAY